MRKVLSTILAMTVVAGTFPALAQKKPLDPSVYDKWQSISSTSIPYSGKYLFYSIKEQEGDNVLYIKDMQGGKTLEISRGNSPVISRDGRKAVCTVRPWYQEVRQAKIKKKKSYQMPKDTLAVIDFRTGSISRYPAVSSFRYGDELRDHLVFKPADVTKTGNRDICVMDLSTLAVDTISSVEHYRISDDGSTLVYSTVPAPKDSTGRKEVHVRTLATGETRTVFRCGPKSGLSLPFLNGDGTRIAFLAQTDTARKVKNLRDVYYVDLTTSGEAVPIVTNGKAGIPEGLGITAYSTVRFGYGDRSLILGLNVLPEEEKKDDTPSFEKVGLVVWVWNNDYLPTQGKGRSAHKAYNALYRFDQPDRVVALADPELPSVSVPVDYEADKVLAMTDKPYRIEQQWEGTRRYDVYEVDLRTGARKRLKEGFSCSNFQTSPDGKYVTYYTYSDRSWHLYEVATGADRNLTEGLPAIFWNDEKDTPSLPGPNGALTWYADASAFFIGSKFDIWKFDPKGLKAPEDYTEGLGVKNDTRFTITRNLSYASGLNSMSGIVKDGKILSGEPLYFSSFNRKTKDAGIYVKDESGRKKRMVRLDEGPYRSKMLGMVNSYEYMDITRTRHSSTRPRRELSIPILVYTKGDFVHPQDIYFTRDYFRTETKLTDINPQQDEYNWGTVEMVYWKTEDGIDAEGLLYKPEDFDPAKKYPMLIYFYEKSSDELHNYRAPAPSRSIINIPYCVSNGYLVFVPNIYYRDGHPGQSAMRSIMPGVDMLCRNSWVNSEKMALQGQSWGGYQTAYMITQTDRFAAAGAGAPVSNMTSAFGGIRWESGNSRQVQYEHGQSRIGKNLWDGFDLYVENSPVFFVPNVKTPVLIMHNDADGAVPWYQGIEFFVSLRRCGKPAWMLQYKDEAHNLVRRHNCKDYSVKLMEFMDHFLKDAPMPEWMKKQIN